MKTLGSKGFIFLVLFRVLLVLALEQIACAQVSTTIHVAKDGVDTNPGTVEKPVATVEKAVALIDTQSGSGIITIHEGVYIPDKTVTIRPPSTRIAYDPNRMLIVQSAENETATFDGSISINDLAAPLDEVPGVYTVKGDFPTDWPPELWEEGSGIQFNLVADLTTVRNTDYSCVVLDRTTLALRARNGDAPKGMNIRMGRVNYGFEIFRSNVIVKGIHFRNYNYGRNSTALRVGDNVPLDSKEITRNTVIDGCSSYNCYKGFWVYNSGINTRITHCQVRNAVIGIMNNGNGTTIEYCTLVNDYGRIFKAPGAYTAAEAYGIRVYWWAKDTTIRFNLIKGFRNAFGCKAEPTPTLVEHNTLIYGQPDYLEGLEASALRPLMEKDFVARYNIFVGYIQALVDTSEIPADAQIDYNLFWGPEFNSFLKSRLDDQKARGVGLHNIVADPMFVAPEKDDYRLLPGSPAVGIVAGEKGGAFDVAPSDYRVTPRVRATLAWISDTQMGDSLYPLHLPCFSCYVSKQRTIRVDLSVVSSAPVVKTRFQVGDVYFQEKGFISPGAFQLPDKDGLHTVRFQVQDAKGAWSEECVIYVTLRRHGVQLISEPKILANRYGALFSFKTDSRASAKLEYQDGTQWVEAANSAFIAESGFPKKFNEITSFPLLVANLTPDTQYKYRLTLSAPLGTTVKEGTFVLSGNPKVIYVSTTGEDADKAGSRERPFRTLQYAFDHALPGDRVRIMPGVYLGAQILNHGGSKEHPLIIEGLYPNTVILDGLWRESCILVIRNAPYVILRNLNVRWFTETGISISGSEGTRVTQCRFHNHPWITNEWPTGEGLTIVTSPNFVVDHCIFFKCFRAGLIFDASPGAKILNNTATACEVAQIEWRDWAGPSDNITIAYNSLNWQGNQFLSIRQPKDTLLHKCLIDYNNYGTTFAAWQVGKKYGTSLPKPFPYLPSNRELQYFADTTDPVKQVRQAFYNLEDWQEFSGQDKHSIFADPKWMDPKAGRFDVKADSPNLLPDGKIIGALGYLGENPTVAPEVVLTTPSSGEVITGVFTVCADASDYKGSIQKVEFYANEKLIGNTTGAPPYQVKVAMTPGVYVIIAKVVNDKGASAESDAVNVYVK